MEVNPIKLQKLCKAENLTPATENEISAINAVAGFASPIGVDKSKCLIVVDDLIAKVNNYVVGANEKDYHFINACYDRDFSADIVGDIISAYDGALCPISDADDILLKSVRGVEIGNIFQLGTKYTQALSATFTDMDGKSKPIYMGSYGIGVGRLLACLCEEYNDEKGLKLPISVVPYQVVITAILETDEVKDISEKLYHTLLENEIEVIYDDRGKKVASAGVKFRDAELIGFPIRLTVSKKSLKNGGIEFKLRDNKDVEVLPIEDILPKVNQSILNLKAEIKTGLDNAEKW